MDKDNFYSIDKLIEFGMSMAVAQQMVQTMNFALNNMYVPGSMHQENRSTLNFYYAIIDGKQAGPFSEQELCRLIQDKKIVSETYMWKPGLSKWDLAKNIPDVLKLVILTPPPFNDK